MQGTIQRLIRSKGFGFVVVEGRQYFLHHSAIRGMKFKQLATGDVVEFEPQEDEPGRNPRATAVTVVQKAESPVGGIAHRGRGGQRAPGNVVELSGSEAGDNGHGEATQGDGEFIFDFSEGDVAPPRKPPSHGRRHRTIANPRPRATGEPGSRGEGIIRSINSKRGFGFIETPQGDLFFHRSGVRDDFANLNVGTRVAFVFSASDRGSKADEVVAM